MGLSKRQLQDDEDKRPRCPNCSAALDPEEFPHWELLRSMTVQSLGLVDAIVGLVEACETLPVDRDILDHYGVTKAARFAQAAMTNNLTEDMWKSMKDC